jgi:hypothetical protein
MDRTRTSRGRLALSATLLGCGLWVALPIASARAAEVGFLPNAGFVCDTLAVDVVIDAGLTDLRGFSLVFEFDPAVVAPIAVTAGGLETGAPCGAFFTWVNSAAVGDSVSVDGATLGCSVAGPGSIVRMTFVTVTHGGTSPLECRSGELRDSLNQPIPYVCHPGTLETCPAVGVETRRWDAMKRLYRDPTR